MVHPILIREMRAEARQPMNYWLRLAGVAAASTIFLAVVYGERFGDHKAGTTLFARLNLALFCGIWVVAPMLVADCISRERREGTLGLLFLTPLTAKGIVNCKSLIQLLRAGTLFCSMLPVLILPFLLGGIHWKDAALACVLDFSALLLALSAGLIASSLCTQWTRALTFGALLSVAISFAFCFTFYSGFRGILLRGQAGAPPGFETGWEQLRHQSISRVSQEIFGFATDPGRETHFLTYNRATQRPSFLQTRWGLIWSSYKPAVQAECFRFTGGLALVSALALAGATRVAAWQVRKSWRDEPPPARKERLARVLSAPVVSKSFMKIWMRRKMNRNPIGWLHQYSLGARIMQWGWCLGFVLVECALVSESDFSSLWVGQYWMAYGLMLSIAFSAASSFQREQKTGAMELLLVTPLKEGKIIIGRLGGLWSQFLPATLILALAWLELAKNARLFARMASTDVDPWSQFIFPVFFVSTYLTLPVIGLHFSMKKLNFLASWLCTIVAGIILPLPVYWINKGRHTPDEITLGMVGTQALVATAAGLLLHRTLTRRSFQTALA